MYWLKVYELPIANRTARGKPIINLLPLEPEERINAFLPVREYTESQFVLMVTSNGTVKKTPLTDFSRPRTNGIIAVDLRDEDCLVGVEITDGQQDVMLFVDTGKAIRFNETDVRPMGRTACGVRGIKMNPGQKVVSMIIVREGLILTVTENGYGKRTPVDDYSLQGRGGQGVISIQTSARNGRVVGAVQIKEEEQMMLISDQGTLVRTRASEVSIVGRNTQGVRLINLSGEEKLVGIVPIAEDENAEEEMDEIAATGETDATAPREDPSAD